MSRRVLVLCAMAEEAAAFHSGDTPVSWRVVTTGIGTVNAAISATEHILEYDPTLVISAGSAGGLGAGVAIGDVVVGSAYRYHSADASAFGYEPGQIPQMPSCYGATHEILTRARNHQHETTPGGPRLHIGEIVSGDAFVTADQVDRVRETFPLALATDMESAAIAQTCHRLEVPFVSIRAISDLCDGSASTSFHLTLEEVAVRAAQWTLTLANPQPMDQVV
ncbi:MAG: 5'-methylthioadenosine/S-adenosylhomocysteine nucleosidase [Bowdeniella nasicola]|nr:5'-methylthioadenosine/S-adenosylhomocysteine nucleosidase [Bowdeniella nasicola]